MNGNAVKTAVASNTALRAALISGLEEIDDESLVSIKVAATDLGVAESTMWRYIKEHPEELQTTKLSARCTRLRVGRLRAFKRKMSSDLSMTGAA